MIEVLIGAVVLGAVILLWWLCVEYDLLAKVVFYLCALSIVLVALYAVGSAVLSGPMP